MAIPPLVVVMGISGVGKSAVGRVLADRLDVDYRDGDDFHSPANIATMASGTPLTDADRWPWLEDVGAWLSGHDDAGGVISCSALKRIHRDVLTAAAPRTLFLHLAGDRELIATRMAGRDHFMPLSLLQSQEQTLEPLQDDESGWVLDITPPPQTIVGLFLERSGLEEYA